MTNPRSLKALAEYYAAKQARRDGKQEKKKNKYGAERIGAPGQSYDSKLEAALHGILVLREKAGEIRDIRAQVTLYMTRARVIYRADYQFVRCSDGVTCYAESKGPETQAWRIKLRIYRFYGPGPLEIWKGSHANPTLVETVIPDTSYD